jgi:hypothetical protein
MMHVVKFANDSFRVRYDSLGLPDKLSDFGLRIPHPLDLASVIRPNIAVAFATFHEGQRGTRAD